MSVGDAFASPGGAAGFHPAEDLGYDDLFDAGRGVVLNAEWAKHLGARWWFAPFVEADLLQHPGERVVLGANRSTGPFGGSFFPNGDILEADTWTTSRLTIGTGIRRQFGRPSSPVRWSLGAEIGAGLVYLDGVDATLDTRGPANCQPPSCGFVGCAAPKCGSGQGVITSELYAPTWTWGVQAGMRAGISFRLTEGLRLAVTARAAFNLNGAPRDAWSHPTIALAPADPGEMQGGLGSISLTLAFR